MTDIPIIDPHFHLWDIEINYYLWLSDGVKPSAFGDYTAINKTYLIEEFPADAKNQNLVKAVHLNVGYDPADHAGEARWLQGAVDLTGFSTWHRRLCRFPQARCGRSVGPAYAIREFSRHPTVDELSPRSGQNLSGGTLRQPLAEMAAWLWRIGQARPVL